MNDFTRLRADSINRTNTDSFPLVFLEKFEKNQQLEQGERILFNQFKHLVELNQKDSLNFDEMTALLLNLGKNTYINSLNFKFKLAI